MATGIQSRGGKFRAQVRIGSFYASRTFNTQSAAKLWKRKTEDAVRAGEYSKHAGMTLEDAIRGHERAMRPTRPLSRTLRGNLERWRETHGQTLVERLTAQDIVDHAAGRDCGPATMAIEVGALRGVLLWARTAGVAVGDPVADAMPALRQRRLIGKPKQRHRRPTQDELRRLHDYLSANKRIPMADIVAFAVETAMRQAEIVGITYEDLDRDKRLVLIRQRKNPRQKRDEWVPLLGQAMDIITRQPGSTGRIFPHHKDSVGRCFTAACKRLGIADLHFHDLRHEGASRLFEQGYSIEQVALVTGHKDWASLKRYTHLKPESLHRD